MFTYSDFFQMNCLSIRKRVLNFLVISFVLLLSSCTSVATLPESAQQVEFSDHIAGVSSTREYDQCHFYTGANLASILQAAKYSLIKNKFTLKRESLSAGVVTAEHGMTSVDWNIVAGIYFTELNKDKIAVKFVVKTAASTSLYQQDLLTAKQWVSRLVDEFNNSLQSNPDAGIVIMKCR